MKTNKHVVMVRPVGYQLPFWRNKDNTVRVSCWGGYWRLALAQTIGGELNESFYTRIELINRIDQVDLFALRDKAGLAVNAAARKGYVI